MSIIHKTGKANRNLVHSSDPVYYWLVITCINKDILLIIFIYLYRFKIEIGKKFRGRISQVKIWAKNLTLTDVYQLDENKDYVPPGSTVVHGWYNFKMNKGVVKKNPTQIEKEVCDVPACTSSGIVTSNRI